MSSKPPPDTFSSLLEDFKDIERRFAILVGACIQEVESDIEIPQTEPPDDQAPL